LNVFGADYDTPDGTGVRDYIHVMDLAAGHLSALRLLDGPKCFAVNLGTGEGSSVLEVVRAFEAVSGRNIPYEVKPRRPGDIGACYAATDYASKLMNWRATRSLETMCADHWRWQRTNPNGYA
jgi:UDP-glucose 4-epimerase